MTKRLKAVAAAALIKFFAWQKPVFLDRTTGVLVLFCSRQIGKSFVLAAWAVDRLLTQLQKNDAWLITVLSNSRDNGGEFALKCHEVCQKIGRAIEMEDNKDELDARTDLAEDVKYQLMRFEIRMTMLVNGVEHTGRIKVLAANPRTARGFSGDLILDEFAFHEDSYAIWDAAEPILSRNPEFLCRISSTANGKHNMFYQMVTSKMFPVVNVTRTMAWQQGVPVYDLVTRQQITPAAARERALDKQSYDQNYENKFSNESGALLTSQLIDNAELEGCTEICEQDWTPRALERMANAEGALDVGVDVARTRNLTVITVGETWGITRFVRGILRIRDMRLPQQQERLEQILRMKMFRRCCIDMTGIGLGLTEYTQERFGTYRVRGINFATTVPITHAIKIEGRKQETVRVTEAMAVELLKAYESRSLKHSPDVELRNDLLKPERIVSPGGRVSIAAVDDVKNHADHFWSFALLEEAARAAGGGLLNTDHLHTGQTAEERIEAAA